MSSMYPPYWGPPAQRCLRCGTPLPPNAVTCMNCGAYNPPAQPGGPAEQGWGGSSPIGNGQPPNSPPQQSNQWGQPASVPPNNPFGPQSMSSPNNFYGMPGQGQQPNFGAPQQNAYYSSATNVGYQPYSRNGYSPGRPPQKKRGPGLIIGIALLVIVLVAGSFGGYLFLKNHNQNGNTTAGPAPKISTPAVKPLFSDSFNNNNNGWDLSSAPGKFSINIGGGSMVLEDDENKLFMEVLPAGNFADFRLDVNARLSKGAPSNGYGVFIRGAVGLDGNLNTYYRFELYGDGTYALFKGILDATGQAQSTKIHNYTASSAILKDAQVNHITIIAKGSSMTVMVNGQTLDTFSDSTYKDGSVALFVSNLPSLPAGAQASFTNLAIFPAT